MISLIPGILKKIQTNLFPNRNRLREFKSKPMVTEGDRLWRRGELGIWDWHMHTVVNGMDGQWGPAV